MFGYLFIFNVFVYSFLYADRLLFSLYYFLVFLRDVVQLSYFLFGVSYSIQNRAGFKGAGGPGPQASHQQVASHQTPQFFKTP